LIENKKTNIKNKMKRKQTNKKITQNHPQGQPPSNINMRTEIVRTTLWWLLSGSPFEGNDPSSSKKEREREAYQQVMEPNPPAWPATVKLIRNTENADEIMAKLKETEDTYDEEAETYTTTHHFSDRRWAILFEPGIYKNLDFEGSGEGFSENSNWSEVTRS
jgi:hypothetical protein